MAFVLAALGAAAATAWLAVYLSRRGLDWAAKFSEIASLVLGAGAVLLPLASRIARWLPAPKLTEEQVASDVADLAAALRIRGRFEGVLAGTYVYDRLPMPVHWRPADELSSEAGREALGLSLSAKAGGVTGTFDTVLEYFRELPEPRLLVLGPAGAGKTVLVTELARRLLATRKGSELVPVIIPVTAWDPRQTSLFDWVSEQLIRINADLAHRVRDGRNFITRAQALVDRMKVLPMLDGLDEIPQAARPMATLAINRYGWAQPLVVTCRTHEYRQIIGMAQGTPVARVATITLLPLEPADIKGYLGPDRNGHWAKVYQRLDAKPDGALAQALANPLMLWLAWAVYSSTGRSPDELADQYRFASAAAIEHHLLAEFVPAVYPDSKGRSAGNRLRRLLSARSEPRRWLGFLASDKHLHSGPQARQRRQPLDLFETRDVQNVAWWRFTGGAGGLRLVSVAARGAFLGFVLWNVIQFVLQRNGNWRHGSYVGPIHFRAMFLSGPLGRRIWPTIVDLIGVAPVRARQHAFSDVTRYSSDIFKPPYSPVVYLLGIVIASLAIWSVAYSEVGRPTHLRIRPTLPLACLGIVLRRVIFVIAVMWVVTILWPRPGFAGAFFTSPSTWYTILAIGLAMGVASFPAKLISQTDVVGAVSPVESLRQDRWADAVVTSGRRAIFAGVVLLFSGPELALAYLVFAATSTVVALTLGGRASSGFTSRSYTDACIWLGLTRRMPRRPMRFLADAARRGVFQEIGAIYRFRHTRVQLQLRDWYEDYRLGARHWQPRQLRARDRLLAYTSGRAITLAGARDRVEGYRALADRNMAEFGKDLADALNAEARLLRERRYREEERNALMQLVATHRQLAEIDADSEPALAGALDQLARRLAEAARHGEASDAMTEAAEIYFRRAVTEPETYQRQLESSLLWLGRASQTNGSPTTAACAFETVLTRYRQLAEDQCGTEPGRGAASLVRLADLLEQHERPDDAVAAINNAVRIHSGLASAGPELGRAAAAASLAELATQLRQFGRDDDAAAALAKSVNAYRELARQEPAEYRLPFIASLDHLAALSAKVYPQAELPLIREAVSEYCAIATQRTTWAPERGDTGPGPVGRRGSGDDGLSRLIRFALRLWELGMREEAVTAAGLGRRLTQTSPEGNGYDPVLALAWSAPSAQSGEPVRAGNITLPGWLSLLVITMHWEGRARFRRSQVEEHDRRAFRLMLAGREDESRLAALTAAQRCRELVAIYRHLADTQPDRYLAGLADSLDLLARHLHNVDVDAAGAGAAAGEAQQIRRRLGLASGQAPHP